VGGVLDGADQAMALGVFNCSDGTPVGGMFELTPNFDGPGVEEKVKEVALDHDPMSNTDTAVLLGGQSGDATTVSTQQGGSTTQQTLVIGQGEGQTAFVDMHKRGDCAWVTGYTDGHTFICKYKRGGDGKYAPILPSGLAFRARTGV